MAGNCDIQVHGDDRPACNRVVAYESITEMWTIVFISVLASVL